MSPVVRWCTQGTWTAASPQPDEPSMSGQKLGWPVVAGVGLGDEVGDLAVGSLLGGEVAQPLHGEAADVVEERGGLDEDLPVAGPPGPLAGGAVGGDVAGVAAEAPLGDAVEAR